MPTYSYQCSACSHAFEQVQRMSDDPIKVCPSCGAESVRRLINSANFILKGSGWYADAYSGGSNKKSGGDAKPAAATGAATPAASTGGDGASSSSSSDGASGSAAAAPAAPAASAPSAPTTTKT
jgi:putative FmdB family regulatory protein